MASTLISADMIQNQLPQTQPGVNDVAEARTKVNLSVVCDEKYAPLLDILPR
jgi:hypothetical protein